MSQREIARALGISVGKTNYCLKALMERGWVKARNFYQSSNKKGYGYLLTPIGVKEKAKVTYRFLKLKMQEHELLKEEIEKIRQEAEALQNEEIKGA